MPILFVRDRYLHAILPRIRPSESLGRHSLTDSLVSLGLQWGSVSKAVSRKN